MDKKFNETIKDLITSLNKCFGTDKRYDISSEIYNLDLYDDISLVKSACENTPGCRILDLGCGKGHITALISEIVGNHVDGVDLHDSFGEGGVFNTDNLGSEWQENVWIELTSKYNVSLSFYDGERINAEDEGYDVVVAYAVIEHVQDEQKFLKEARRVLKDGGFMLLFRCPSSVSYSENLARLVGLPHHDRLYSREKLTKLFKDSGFKVVQLQKYDSYFAFSPVAKLQNFWNRFIPLHKLIRKILSLPPFSFFSHHYRIVLQK